MAVSLGVAARLCGRSKSTLSRAVQAGRLSATRRADGSYELDVAELSRVYSVSLPTGETPTVASAPVAMTRHATPERDPETVARLAAMEAEIAGLKALIAEVRQSRDDWRTQAERLALAPPSPPPPCTSAPSAWWRRLVG